MIKIDYRSLGKKIFEQEYVGKYNPETKLFENRNGGLRNIYKERSLSALNIYARCCYISSRTKNI